GREDRRPRRRRDAAPGNAAALPARRAGHEGVGATGVLLGTTGGGWPAAPGEGARAQMELGVRSRAGGGRPTTGRGGPPSRLASPCVATSSARNPSGASLSPLRGAAEQVSDPAAQLRWHHVTLGPPRDRAHRLGAADGRLLALV